MEEQHNKQYVLELAADVVASYVSNNNLPASELPSLISSVYSSFAGVADGSADKPAEKPKPAVPIRKSITDEYLVCLEDGKPFKSLKRHLRTHYDLSPEQYRERWGLPSDYPMVAPAYAKQRSKLAKKMGLGRKASR